MKPQECRSRFSNARVARLATSGLRGPHMVPIVFAGEGDMIFTAVDAKPKRTRDLRRLANIEADPAVAVLVDHYSDDWEQLWWVRADGRARIVRDKAAMAPGIDLLVARYAQYQSVRPAGPLIAISVAKWTGWAARPDRPPIC